MSALHQLLTQIVDYAGLFPPAGLDLNSVVKNYDRYRQSEANWMLARLIIPASRLDEFLSAADLDAKSSAWPISALVPGVDAPDEAFPKAIASIIEFNSGNPGAIVDAVEIKCPLPEHVEIISAQIPETIRAFLEVPHQADPVEHLQAIQATGNLFAKIRTGAVTEDLIPSTGEVARFIHRCAEMGVGFKATAGLHHPVRNEFKLTYQPDAASGTMHGFLNVFVASMLAYSGASETQIDQVLQARSIDEFTFSESHVEFAGQSVSASEIETIRKNKAISFGSCSFEEPIADLRGLGFESEIQPAV